MQQSLFDDKNQNLKKKELIISAKKHKPLNAQQNSFNKLVKKIKILRRDLEKRVLELDEKLSFYGKEIHPLEMELNTTRKEVIKVMFGYFKNRKAVKGEKKKSLKRFLESFLDDILSFETNTPDQELKDIFKAVKGISYEEAASIEFEGMKSECQSVFKDANFDFDMDNINKNMSEEEVAEQMKNIFDSMENQQENKKPDETVRKKTARELKKEAKEKQVAEARNKNVSSMYKQMAKVFHPDLEPDETLKLQKHVLMQRLTVAYKNNDLHTMLMLEMEWIQKEEHNIDKLSSDKLSIYNQVLKEQVEDLERQKFQIAQHPRYLPLLRYAESIIMNDIDLKRTKLQLANMIKSMKDSQVKFKGKGALNEVYHIIEVFELSEINLDLDFFFDEDDDHNWN